MKKLLLTLALGTAILGATAQTAEDVTQETFSTDDATGITTIVDTFTGDKGPVADQKAASETPSSWKFENGLVDYTTFRTNFSAATYGEDNVKTKDAYLQILAAEGAYLEITIPEYNCEKIVIASNKSPKNGTFEYYAGDQLLETIQLKGGVEEVVIDIPEEYREAGTKYKILNKFQKDVDKTNYRLQISSITYTCTPKEQEPTTEWAAPEFNIPNGSYVLPGQKITVSFEEGGTLTGTVTYKTSDSTEQKVVLNNENNTFIVPDNLANQAGIKFIVSVSGDGHLKSDIVTYIFNFTNGKNLRLNSAELYNIRSSEETQFVYFWFNALNYDTTTASLFVDIEVFENGTSVVKFDNITVSRDACNPKAVAAIAEEDSEEIVPVLPKDYNGTVSFKDAALVAGKTYTANVYVKVGKSGTPRLVNAEPHSFTVNKMYTSGVEDVENAENVEPVYYNLQGVRVEPVAGQMLIRVCGSKVQKVVIR